jgi:hypothetical protein
MAPRYIGGENNSTEANETSELNLKPMYFIE